MQILDAGIPGNEYPLVVKGILELCSVGLYSEISKISVSGMG